jgi:DNA primase catalytic subunit
MLEEKLKELEGLSTVILLNKRFITRLERDQIDAIQHVLEERLKELVAESKLKEVEIKIEQMGKVVKILKQNKYKVEVEDSLTAKERYSL